ncbi:MAG: subtilase-type protease inhibitor [Actinomycetota bacterium]|nr:subtilase-type protease inhibitor [Actinomycetota bacterium]
MRMVGIGLVALFLATSGAASTSPVTALKVTYWSNGANESESKTWTLRCEPASGTVARPGVACRKLVVGGRKLFAPVPRSAICTEIYGGPDTARITGVVAGRRVWATFNLTNGCHIDRWSRFSPWLLPPI